MKINKVAFNSSAYPDILRTLSDPPQELFWIGTPLEEALKAPTLAVVGSRKASAYGLQVTTRIVSDLAGQGIAIISGLALGIDGVAHRAALDAGGLTIAVMACGLDQVYPGTHRALAASILKQGGTLVSEYPEGMEPQKHHFIARNRIIAGLSQGVLITEAAAKSGSLHTADFALDQGKPVMAVPGPISADGCTGTNGLIKNGAALITSATDVLNELGMVLRPLQSNKTAARPEPQQTILNLIDAGVTGMSELQASSRIDVTALNQSLTMLELDGLIRPAGVNTWSRVR